MKKLNRVMIFRLGMTAFALGIILSITSQLSPEFTSLQSIILYLSGFVVSATGSAVAGISIFSSEKEIKQ